MFCRTLHAIQCLVFHEFLYTFSWNQNHLEAAFFLTEFYRVFELNF